MVSPIRIVIAVAASILAFAGTTALAGGAAGAAGTGQAITVQPGGEQVVIGQPVTYTITVDNPDEGELTTTLRASVPPRLVNVTAPDGEIGDGYVRWSVTVAAHDTATRQLTGVYEPTDERGDPDRVTFTACLLDSDGQPQACATDLAEAHTRSPTAGWWLAGGGLVMAAVGTALLLLLRRRQRGPATR